MSEITVSPALPVPLLNRLLRYIGPAVVLLLLATGVWAYRAWTTPAPNAPAASERTAATTISMQTLEERYGIRFRLLGVTAAGGMVDFRYKIIDNSKVTALAEYLNKISLIAEDGTTLRMAEGHGMSHEARMENGAINFHFFANASNAIKPGRPVTIVIGPVRLEAVSAQ